MNGKNLLLPSKIAVKLEEHWLSVVRKPLPKISRSAPVSYLHSMSPMHGQTQLVCFSGVCMDLQPCKIMTGTLAPVEHTNWE